MYVGRGFFAEKAVKEPRFRGQESRLESVTIKRIRLKVHEADFS